MLTQDVQELITQLWVQGLLFLEEGACVCKERSRIGKDLYYVIYCSNILEKINLGLAVCPTRTSVYLSTSQVQTGTWAAGKQLLSLFSSSPLLSSSPSSVLFCSDWDSCACFWWRFDYSKYSHTLISYNRHSLWANLFLSRARETGQILQDIHCISSKPQSMSTLARNPCGDTSRTRLGDLDSPLQN